MTRALLFAVWFAAAAAAAQLTPEVSVADPQTVPATNVSRPSVATNGSDFLAAWVDARGNIFGDVYVSRVTRDGRVLDNLGIRLPLAGATGALLFGVYRTEGAYTVIYRLSEAPTGRTVATIVNDYGVVIDGPKTLFKDDEFFAAAATNGSRIVILTSKQLVVSDGRGNVVERIAYPFSTDGPVRIGSNGSTFLLATATAGEISLVGLDANGRPGDVVRVAAAGEAPSRIASAGTDYVVIFMKSLLPDGFVARVISPTGQIRATTTLHVTSIEGLEPGDLVWTGNRYLMLVRSSVSNDIDLLSLDPAIATAHAQLLGESDGVYMPVISSNGRDALVVWTGPGPPFLKGVTSNGDATSISPPFAITTSGNLQASPVITTAGSQDLVVWAETTGIYATRITDTGIHLDDRGIKVTTKPNTSGVQSRGFPLLRAIFDGTSYVVVWGDPTGVFEQRLDPQSGMLLGPAAQIATCSRAFDVAIDNQSPVLFTRSCTDPRIFAQRFGPAAAIGAPVPITPPNIGAAGPDAAWNGIEWLIGWGRVSRDDPPFLFVDRPYVTRMTAGLTVLDVEPIALDDSSSAAPLIATNGNDFAAVWPANTAIYTRQVRSDGSFGERTVIAAADNAVPNSVAWSAGRYALAYTADGSLGDIFLTHIGLNDQIRVSTTDTDERYPSLLAVSNRPMRIVYTRVAPEPPFGGVAHVFMRDEYLSPRRRSVRQR